MQIAKRLGPEFRINGPKAGLLTIADIGQRESDVTPDHATHVGGDEIFGRIIVRSLVSEHRPRFIVGRDFDFVPVPNVGLFHESFGLADFGIHACESLLV